MAPKKVKPRPELDAVTFPYLVIRPYQEKPQYYRSWKDARARVLKDLETIGEVFDRLQAADAKACLLELNRQVERLPLHGGVIEGVVDPFSGQKYKAEVRRREAA